MKHVLIILVFLITIFIVYDKYLSKSNMKGNHNYNEIITHY
jgi:hypothetical protein